MPLANTPPPPYTSRPGIAPVSVLLTIDDDTKSCMDRIGKVEAQIESMLLKVVSYREELNKSDIPLGKMPTSIYTTKMLLDLNAYVTNLINAGQEINLYVKIAAHMDHVSQSQDSLKKKVDNFQTNYRDLIEKFEHCNVIDSSLILHMTGLLDSFENIIEANRTADEDCIAVRRLTSECISRGELEKEDELCREIEKATDLQLQFGKLLFEIYDGIVQKSDEGDEWDRLDELDETKWSDMSELGDSGGPCESDEPGEIDESSESGELSEIEDLDCNSGSVSKMDSDSEDTSSYGDMELSEEETNFRQTFLERIDKIQATGRFATGNVVEAFPIPCMSVDGGEPIAIPLSEEAAQDLASKSNETGQISANRISFQNPQWDGFVNKLVQHVAYKLGAAPRMSKIRAELYKHLLYKPGATSKDHIDTEKNPGTFGLLVICLPSQHTGGTVCLQHNEKSLELSAAKTSAHNISYFACYTDVTHKIKRVQTGYQWVLMYNLIIDHKSSELPSASALEAQTQCLVESLTSWQTLQSPPDFLIYPLDHPYAPIDLRLSSLKGLDDQRTRCLADSCNQHGEFCLLFARFSKYMTIPDNNGGESCMDCWQSLHQVCSLRGINLSQLKVDVDKVLPLKSVNYVRVPNRENLGGGLEQVCSIPVLLIVRADSLHAPLFNPRDLGQVYTVMRHLRAGNNDDTKTTLLRLCRIILNEGCATKAANDEYLGHVIATAADLGDWPLYREARKKTLQTANWDSSAWYSLGKIFDPQIDLEADDLSTSVMKDGTLWRKYWTQWYSDKLIEMFNSANSHQDSVSIIKRNILGNEVQFTPEQRKKLDEAVTGFVKRFKDVKDFVDTLNIDLLLPQLSNPKDNARTKFLRDLFGVILESAISTFDFGSYNNKYERTPQFFKQALAHDKDSAFSLLRQFSKTASEGDQSAVLKALRSVIRELLLFADTGSLEVQSQQTCCQLLLEAYITKAAGDRPLEPTSWARPAEVKECYPECIACKELNLFLKDPQAEETTIALTADDQRHVELIFCYLQPWNGDRGGEVRFAKTLEEWEIRRRSWKSRVKAAKAELQRLLGDKYDWFLGSTSQPKRKMGDTNDGGAGGTSKRARRGGEKNED
ncbi:hypothetical protein MKX08_006540 [Trichoderma sp. CBMAI-0020]|nr:hypothetical protein MKX08_006540 [Trichoderma sp. CBMAI-0020]WOD46114.1 hypothetical protein [Trichoderma atroviride]